MKLLKNYKGVAVFFFVITTLNLVWILNYDNPTQNKQVSNEKIIVANM